MCRTTTMWSRIKARHLHTDIYAIAVSVLGFAVSTYLYYFQPVESVVFGEFQLALSTSLLAAIFMSLIDFYNKYKNYENALFIENLYEFGIRNLYFDKKEVLERFVQAARKEIWISGYRLILTKKIAKQLHEARMRGVAIRMLLCPPWSYTHCLVYSDVDRTIDRYIDLLTMIIANGSPEVGSVQIRFTEQPLFNDTYLCDNYIVTSPYMHNHDLTYGKISATDFFTYEVERHSRLYDLLRDEYETLFENAEYEISHEEIIAALSEISDKPLEKTYYDKVVILTNHMRLRNK